MANTSAQVIEMKHLSIKSDAARTNNKTNWELQVLIKQQRRHTMEQSWQPKDADDDEDDTKALWVPRCKPRARICIYVCVCMHMHMDVYVRL